MKPLLIGIDPAFRKSGFCACVIDQENEVQFKTFKNGFLDFMKWADDLPEGVIICIENSNLQNVTFETPTNKKQPIGVRLKKSRNVGANQAASQYTVDYCMAKFGNKKVLGISPLTKGAKWVKDSTFLRVVKAENHKLINYTGTQDQRDAYKLALLGWQFRYKLGVF
jgi:hypothetical protein